MADDTLDRSESDPCCPASGYYVAGIRSRARRDQIESGQSYIRATEFNCLLERRWGDALEPDPPRARRTLQPSARAEGRGWVSGPRRRKSVWRSSFSLRESRLRCPCLQLRERGTIRRPQVSMVLEISVQSTLAGEER